MVQFLIALLFLPRVDATLRVAFLSDLHVGESCSPTPYNGTENCACIANDRRAISFLNALSPLPDAVIITGDLTSSSWPTQWVKAKEILDGLKVPYFATMGNHDVWSYDREGGNETLGPYGDQLFWATFGPSLAASPNVSGYAPAKVHNPLWNTTSAFQNFVVNLVEPSTGARLAFLAGDWSTRGAATCANCSGVPGWAERGLSNFPGGVLPWLRDQLAALARAPAHPDKLFLIQHQPITCPFWVPDFAFCFGAADKLLLAEALLEHWPRDAWWGVFAGHNHAYLNQSTPFDGWPAFREFETSAAKGDSLDNDVASAVTVVSFEGTAVTLIEEHYYSLAGRTWTTKRGV